MQKLTALALAALLGKASLAQTMVADTALLRQGVEAAVASYHLALGPQAGLYNGVEHMRYLPTIEGLPYFVVDDWQSATIRYDDVLYRDVPVRYDLVKDALIVSHPDGFRNFYLFSPRVDSFTIGAAHFVYLVQDSAKGAPAPGFYQVLARGPMTVLARRSRKIEERLQERNLYFMNTDRFYILKDGVYHSPRNEGDLLELVGDRRKEARQLLKQRALRFRKFPEQAILTVAGFYNQ
ncbi:MAG TPA: hypothetical protein VGE66_04955 [Chitinophagaceae bacterium]